MAPGNSLTTKAYQYLHDKLRRGDLNVGTRLSELELAAAIGISRTPVREALKQLEQEGLVEAVPRFGTIVRAPDRREIEELYEVREALESYAAARAAERAGDDDVKAIEGMVAEMRTVAKRLGRMGTLVGTQRRRFLAADFNFHARLIEAAGNSRLSKSVGDSRLISDVFGNIRTPLTAQIAMAAVRFHQDIANAIKGRDPEAARKAMVSHVRQGKREALEQFDQQAARPRDGLPRSSLGVAAVARATNRRGRGAGASLAVILVGVVTSIATTLDPSAAHAQIIARETLSAGAPTAENHASTIVETPLGLVSGWSGGTHEGLPDAEIWISRRRSGRWVTPTMVADGRGPEGQRWPCWNPVRVQHLGDPLQLFYKVGPSPQAWWGMQKTFHDGGGTWSDARRLPDGILGPIKNKPLRLANGSLLIGSSTENAKGWRVHFER